jgi:hypothetical protein
MDTNVQFLFVSIRGYEQDVVRLDGSVTDSVGAIELNSIAPPDLTPNHEFTLIIF